MTEPFIEKLPKELPSKWREFYQLAMEFAAEIEASSHPVESCPDQDEDPSIDEVVNC